MDDSMRRFERQMQEHRAEVERRLEELRSPGRLLARLDIGYLAGRVSSREWLKAQERYTRTWGPE